MPQERGYGGDAKPEARTEKEWDVNHFDVKLFFAKLLEAPD